MVFVIANYLNTSAAPGNSVFDSVLLLGLFFDGVAGLEAEEAAADLHDAALPLCLLLLSADDASCPPESSQMTAF